MALDKYFYYIIMKRIIIFLVILINLGFAQQINHRVTEVTEKEKGKSKFSVSPWQRINGISNGAKYLIITHDNFYDAIQPLAQWKQKKGIKTKVVKLSELNAAPESLVRIKNYIVNAYNTWNPRPEYILLVGSPHFIRSNQNKYDDYYADMSGNFLMELSVGRLPCSTATQCSVMVYKTLGYERTPYVSDTLWYKKGTGIIREDENAIDSVYWNNMRYVFGLWRTAGYVQIDSFSKLRGDSARHVESAITNGRAYVVFRGQGVTNWWSPFAIDATRMNNGFRLPIIISSTCATINLEPNVSYLGENCMRAGTVTNPKGTVAFVGTTNSESGPGLAELRGTVSQYLLKSIFTDQMFKLGDVLKRAKFILDSLQPPYYSIIRYREWNLLGDPELNVWTSVPKQLTVVYDSVIPIGQQTYTVLVRQGTNPVSNALVCVMKDTVIYQYNYTNTSGIVSFSINPQSTGTMSLTVTAQNCRAFEGTIRVRTNSIEENSKLLISNSKFRVFPNPCHDITEIFCTNSQSLNTNPQILIYDVQGRIRREVRIRKQEARDKIKIDLGNLPAGIYMVVVKKSETLNLIQGMVLGKVVKR